MRRGPGWTGSRARRCGPSTDRRCGVSTSTGVGGDRGAGCCAGCSPARGIRLRPGPAATPGRGSPLIVGAEGPLRHAVRMPPRAPGAPAWPEWVPPPVRAGVRRPGRAASPGATRRGPPSWRTPARDVVVATGTASGKSLAYQLPVLAGVRRRPPGHRPLPLAHQGAGRRPAAGARGARAARTCGPPPSTATPRSPSADWARQHGRWLFSNPDMLHRSRAAAARPVGRAICAGCATSCSTSATPTAGCSARTWRCCCAACCGSAPGTERGRRSCWRRRRWRIPAAFASRLTGREVVAVSDDGSPSGGPHRRAVGAAAAATS